MGWPGMGRDGVDAGGAILSVEAPGRKPVRSAVGHDGTPVRAVAGMARPMHQRTDQWTDQLACHWTCQLTCR
jgi:hypothetical protein